MLAIVCNKINYPQNQAKHFSSIITNKYFIINKIDCVQNGIKCIEISIKPWTLCSFIFYIDKPQQYLIF